MDEDNFESGVDELVEHSATIKDIIMDLTQNAIAISIVLSVLYLAITNNQADLIKTSFDVVIGFWIGTSKLIK